MGVTANYSFPYPEGISNNNVPADMQALADAIDAQLASSVGTLWNPGMMMDFAGPTAPAGWALCQGQLVSKASNPVLWAMMGETYGPSTSTDFTLPDLRSRIVAGKGTATWSNALGQTGGSKDSVAVAHSHTGATDSDSHNHSQYLRSNAGARTDNVGSTLVTTPPIMIPPERTGSDSHSHGVTTNATGVAGTDQNLPPYMTLNKIIRLG